MSWCEATPQTPATIELAQFLRRRHVPVRTWRGKRCADCGAAWRRHGCRQYLWATDYLSRLSRIVLADRPSRPKCGRHRPAYTEKLRDYAAVAEEHIAIQTRLRHQRRADGRRPASPAHIHQRHTTRRPAVASASVPARSGASVPASRPAPRPGALSAPHSGRRPLGPETARNAAPEAPAPIPRPAAVSTPHPSRRILGRDAARNATTEVPAPAPTFAARNRTQYQSARFAQAAAPAPKPEPVPTPAPRQSVRGGVATEPDRVGAPVSWQLYP